MTGAEMTYGALSAKVRALYGKRLRTAEFEQMAAMRSVQEILDFLQKHRGWSRAAGHLSTGPGVYVGRVELEAALRDELRLEYLSLTHFVPREDKLLMQFRIRVAEREAILNMLRRLRAGKYAKGMPPPPNVVLWGKVDYPILRACHSYDEVLEAVKDTIYYPVLRHLRPESGGPLPDYTVTEALMEATYFSYVFRQIHERYRGKTQAVLLQAFGEQVDLLNLIHILRLKTFFPNTELELYLTILYPFNYRLSPALTREMCDAPDVAAVFALIRNTHYAKSFENVEVAEVEDYYRRAFYSFNRRQLLSGTPSIYTAMAYLSVKETELRVLINLVESVKYGVAYDAEFARLVGA